MADMSRCECKDLGLVDNRFETAQSDRRLARNEYRSNLRVAVVAYSLLPTPYSLKQFMHWYRSLYWRIALGFVAFLAAMLVVQAVLFAWVVARSGRTLPGQSPNDFAQTVALDLANALERDPTLDLARYVHEQYAQATHPFFVDAGRRPARHERQRHDLPSRSSAWRARRASRRRAERFDRFDPPDGRSVWELDATPAAVPAFASPGPFPIVVNGQTAGVVVVPPHAPFGFLLGRFAPMLALVATGVLIVGTVLTSVMIFGPARRRLRALEAAARRLGAGDLTARAPDRGGDEIAAVASAFNAMADDLAARAEALAASDRARRQLLADVSHELTTPVTAMRGYLETLTMPELALDEATRARYLTIIGDETARLERIIGDLLDLARLEGGGGSLTIERGAGRAALRARRGAARARVSAGRRHDADVDRARRRARCAAIAIGSSRRCRTWRPTRIRYAPRGHRRCGSAARPVDRRRRARRSRTKARASPPSTCRTSSIGSTRRRRRGAGRQRRAAAGWGCRS